MSTDTHYSSTTTSFEIENEAFYIEEDAILPNKSLASNKNSKPSDTCKQRQLTLECHKNAQIGAVRHAF